MIRLCRPVSRAHTHVEEQLLNATVQLHVYTPDKSPVFIELSAELKLI